MGDNPIYGIRYSDLVLPIIGFSKRIEDDFNPKKDFIAIMTCDEVNEACPVVPGAQQRIPIPYVDPKAFDHTPLQKLKYKEKSLEIATEMVYIFSQIKAK